MKGRYIYLDNAATTYPKPMAVISKTLDFIKNSAANPGRAAHRMSLAASEEIYGVRERIARFFDTDEPENVVFTAGATAALNLAIKTGVKDGAHLLISDMEHNSVLRTVHAMKLTRGTSYSVFDSDRPEESIRSLISPNTTHIISTLASNVDGTLIDLKTLSDISERYGLKLILDATQLAGHAPISLRGINFDAFCCAGHKALFGLMGVGFCIFSDSKDRTSFIEGGSGSMSKSLLMPDNLPERYEAGTLMAPAIISLGAGIEYIESEGLENIQRHLEDMTDKLLCSLGSFERIDLCRGNLGTAAFTVRGERSEDIAQLLDKCGFAVRAGFHCAPLMHKKLGTYADGAVRVSLSHLNTEKDIMHLTRALKSILN